MAQRKPRRSVHAERQAKHEAAKKERGWRRIAIWVAPGIDLDKVKAYATKKWGQE